MRRIKPWRCSHSTAFQQLLSVSCVCASKQGQISPPPCCGYVGGQKLGTVSVFVELNRVKRAVSACLCNFNADDEENSPLCSQISKLSKERTLLYVKSGPRCVGPRSSAFLMPSAPRALLDYMYLQQLNKHLHFSSAGEDRASGLQHISIM